MVDYLFRRQTRFAIHGGALNGQQYRRQLVLDLLHAIRFDHLYETGALYGSSTMFFAQHFAGRIVTIDNHPYYHGFTKLRLRSEPRVEVAYADSVAHRQATVPELPVPSRI